MSNFDEGYIKYTITWDPAPPLQNFDYVEITQIRNQLRNLGWIGVYRDDIGFGNISCRLDTENRFLISGTQTGFVRMAGMHEFTVVTGFDLSKNTLECEGPVQASSEALSHAAFYSANKNINAVIHVHHKKAWKKLLNTITTVDKTIEYGTVEMADAIKQLMGEDEVLKKNKILVTAGHEEGIFSFGNDLNEPFLILQQYIQTNKG